LINNWHFVAMMFAPYLLAANCLPEDTSNQNDNGNPVLADRDGDGICDPDAPADVTDCIGVDNCPDTANADQEDTDGDGVGDACESAGPSGSISGRIVPIEDRIALSVMRNGRRVAAFAGGRVPHVPDELLVVYDDDSDDTRREIQATQDMQLISASPSGIHRYLCGHWPCATTKQKRYLSLLHQAKALRQLPGVRFAEINGRRYPARVPNDPLYEGNQQWHYEAINLPQAWDITVGDESIVLGLVDTGVLLDHPDLQGRFLPGFDFISDEATSNDGDGLDDDADDPGDSTFGRSSFHGTHVAGIMAAASNNGLGVAGVTWNCKVLPIRAIGVGFGSVADIVEGMLYAGGLPNVSGTVPDQPVRVLNLSLGGVAGEAESPIERAAIQDLVAAGITVIAASGNQGSSDPAPPAFYPETISVGAVDATLGRPSYSNYGSTLDMVGPGGKRFRDDNDDGFDDGVFSTKGDDSGDAIEFTYDLLEGTSMACPHVTGVIGLMLSVNPDLTADEVRSILLGTAIDLGDTGRDDEFGYGLVDAEAAVIAAQNGDIPILPDEPDGPDDPGEPLLSLSTDDVDLGLVSRTEIVSVSNSGTGMLNIFNITPLTDDDGDWLSVTTSGSNDTTNVTTIEITIDREGLEPNFYGGVLLVEAVGLTPVLVAVEMEVPEITFEGTIIIEAIDLGTGEVVATAETTDLENFDYVFSVLPVGQYTLIAGTDFDGDGEICEGDDLCGMFEDTITVLENETASDLDFLVSPPTP